MDLFLSHNPYKITTVFRIEDKNCDAAWFTDLSSVDGSSARLQMWIGEFFDKLHEAYPGKDKFYLTYKGTSADCRDVEEESALASERLGIDPILLGLSRFFLGFYFDSYGLSKSFMFRNIRKIFPVL